MTSVLNQKTLFSFDHNIYWPERYERVMQYLQNGKGETANEQSLYKLNVEVLVLAACVGLTHDNFVDLPPSEMKKEISLGTFISNNLGIYLYLIPMLAQEETNIDFFRTKEGEDKAISIFERYAAGGLEILNAKLLSNSLDSPYIFTSNLKPSGNDDVRDIDVEIF